MILDHFDKNNLHHAYLIEGIHTEIVPEIFKFIKEIGIETISNPDFFNIAFDSFKVEDARNLKTKSREKGFSSGLSAQAGKKIYIISINNFLLDAQNTLLKMFEEPIENTHFFIIVPEVDSLLKTLVSRFYLIKPKANLENELIEAKKFISLSLQDRIVFIKNLLVNEEEDEEDSILNTNTPKLKALKFLNALELVLHNKYFNTISKGIFDNQKNISFFDQIFKVREFLRQPGASSKSLMESIALSVPVF